MQRTHLPGVCSYTVFTKGRFDKVLNHILWDRAMVLKELWSIINFRHHCYQEIKRINWLVSQAQIHLLLNCAVLCESWPVLEEWARATLNLGELNTSIQINSYLEPFISWRKPQFTFKLWGLKRWIYLYPLACQPVWCGELQTYVEQICFLSGDYIW